MRPFLFALIGSIFLLAGCSKEFSQEGKGEEGEFVRFRLDGEQQEYVENVLALRSTTNNLQEVVVQGLRDLSATPAGMQLFLSEPTPIVAKTYPEVLGADAPALLYRDTAQVQYSNLFMTTASGLEIVISEIDSAKIRGTFKGNISDIDGNIHEVADGAFYARFQ